MLRNSSAEHSVYECSVCTLSGTQKSDLDVTTWIVSHRGDFVCLNPVSNRRKQQTKPIHVGSVADLVYYGVIKRELKRRPIYECRCDERIKTKDDGSTLLTYTG